MQHGVAGIHRQVDDHLLKLSLVDAHQTEIAAMHQAKLDGLADQATDQVAQVGQHIGDIQHLRHQSLLAREGEQLAHQIGGGRIQWLAARAAALPTVVAVPLAQSRRRLRARLVELGELLTGDAARAELAFERAFALA
jgi:hypothetical protein